MVGVGLEVKALVDGVVAVVVEVVAQLRSALIDAGFEVIAVVGDALRSDAVEVAVGVDAPAAEAQLGHSLRDPLPISDGGVASVAKRARALFVARCATVVAVPKRHAERTEAAAVDIIGAGSAQGAADRDAKLRKVPATGREHEAVPAVWTLPVADLGALPTVKRRDAEPAVAVGVVGTGVPELAVGRIRLRGVCRIGGVFGCRGVRVGAGGRVEDDRIRRDDVDDIERAEPVRGLIVRGRGIAPAGDEKRKGGEE